MLTKAQKRKRIEFELETLSKKINDAKIRREFVTMSNLIYEYGKLKKELGNE
jgi:hypothetical protein